MIMFIWEKIIYVFSMVNIQSTKQVYTYIIVSHVKHKSLFTLHRPYNNVARCFFYGNLNTEYLYFMISNYMFSFFKELTLN